MIDATAATSANTSDNSPDSSIIGSRAISSRSDRSTSLTSTVTSAALVAAANRSGLVDVSRTPAVTVRTTPPAMPQSRITPNIPPRSRRQPAPTHSHTAATEQ
jgi:hypothetical protein